jgi:hypothetical protein
MYSNIYRNPLTFLFTGLLVILLWSCDDDKDEVAPQYTINDFVGSWIATSVVHTNNADPSQTFDIVANGGEVRFTMLQGGGTRHWVEIDTFVDEWDAQVRLSGNVVTSTPEESTRNVRVSTFEYDGTTLVLTDDDDIFDFTLMDNEEAAVSTTSVGRFVRH